MTYSPPAPNTVDFPLAPYTPPQPDAKATQIKYEFEVK